MRSRPCGRGHRIRPESDVDRRAFRTGPRRPLPLSYADQLRQPFRHRPGPAPQRGQHRLLGAASPGRLARSRGGRGAGRRRRRAGQGRGRQPARLRAGRQGVHRVQAQHLPSQVLCQMFTAANLAVYDANLHNNGRAGKMATTLTVSVFRNNEVTVGHVGDCRVYVIQQGRIRRVTNDHSYAGVQLKLGLITVQDAMSSQLRSVLTRSVGQEPIDPGRLSTRVTVNARRHARSDVRRRCGASSPRGKSSNVVDKLPPEEACKELIRLAEKRGADDNLSVQITQGRTASSGSATTAGLPTYQKVEPRHHGQRTRSRADAGRPLRDHRPDQPQRHGLASSRPPTASPTSRRRGGAEGAVHAVRERPRLLQPVPARAADRPDAATTRTSCASSRRTRRPAQPAVPGDGVPGGPDAGPPDAQRPPDAGRTMRCGSPAGSARRCTTCTSTRSSTATSSPTTS